MKKIADLPTDGKKRCKDKSHLPPTMISLPDGVYEHRCPTCGKITIVTINNPKM